MGDAVNIETEELTTPEGDAADLIDAVVPDAGEEVVETKPASKEPKTQAKLVETASKHKNGRAAERQNDRDAGRTSLLDAYNKKAQENGYADLDSMIAAVGRGGAKPAKDDQRVAKLSEELEALRTENRKLSNTLRGLRGQISRMESDAEITSIAYEAGVNGDDIDHAKSLLEKKFKRLSDEDRGKFSVEAFFKEELPKSKPGLFRTALEAKRQEHIEEKPVTNSPPSDKGRVVDQRQIKDEEAGAEQPKLATSMSRKEYLERLEKMGIKNPAAYT